MMNRIKQIIMITFYFGPLIVFGFIFFYLFKNGQIIPALFVLLFTLSIAVIVIAFFDKIKFEINYKKIIIDDMDRKIKNINEELKLLPDDEILSDIKEIKRKTINELTKQINDLKKIYLRNMFKDVYVLMPPNAVSSNEIKKAYSVIAEKYFGTNKIKFVTNDDIEKKIGNLEIMYSRNNLESLGDKFIKVISKDYDISIKRDYIDFKKI